MKRRELLCRAGVTVCAAASLSGCTSHRLQESEREPPLADGLGEEEVDIPTLQSLEAAAAGIERATEADITDLDEFEAYLDETSVDVAHLEETTEDGERLLSLKYVAAERHDQGLMHHLGIVAGGYAALVEAGHEGEKLMARLLDSSSSVFGEFEIRRHWAQAYNEDELTAREYADEVVVTVKTT